MRRTSDAEVSTRRAARSSAAANSAALWPLASAGGATSVITLPARRPAACSTSRPTALGAAAVAAYAARAGADEASYAASLGATPTPELAGQAVASLATDPALDQPAYLLTGAGLRPVG